MLAVTGSVGTSADPARAELWDLASGELVRRLDVDLPPITTPYRGQVFIDDAARHAVIVVPAQLGPDEPCCIEHVIAVDLTTGKQTASRDFDARIAVGGGFMTGRQHSSRPGPVTRHRRWMDAATSRPTSRSCTATARTPPEAASCPCPTGRSLSGC